MVILIIRAHCWGYTAQLYALRIALLVSHSTRLDQTDREVAGLHHVSMPDTNRLFRAQCLVCVVDQLLVTV